MAEHQTEQERSALARRRLLGLAIVVIVGAGGVFYFLNRGNDLVTGEIVMQARLPAALDVREDGSVVFAERVTGEIWEVTPEPNSEGTRLADVDVSIGNSRGLVGVAVDEDDRVFAAWTRESDERLVVAQVSPGDERLVWEGPPVPDENIGGHIDFMPDGLLLIGVGDLGDPDAAVDPANPHGKFLTLDPDGDADQSPETLSGGWTDPTAFEVTADGAVWVADDMPEDVNDRLTRGDLDARSYPITELSEDTGPAGLAVVEDRIYVCGFESRRMLRYRIRGNSAPRNGPVFATNCSLDVAALPDGRLTYSNEGTVFTLDPDAPAP